VTWTLFGMGLDKLFSDLELDDINVLLDTVPTAIRWTWRCTFRFISCWSERLTGQSSPHHVVSEYTLVWPLPLTAP